MKFKDADLIGIPFRVVVGAEKLRQGKVELFERAARKADLVERDSVVEALRRRLAAAAPSPK